MLWTANHLEILTRLWPSRSASNIGNIVNRSGSAIKRKAQILGLAKKQCGRVAIVWTDEKNSALTKVWLAGDSIRTIAIALKVSHPSVLKQASRLGLKGRPRVSENWTIEKIERLKELWPLDEYPAVAIGKEIGMPRRAVIGKAWRLNLPAKKKMISNQYTGKPKMSAVKPKASRDGGNNATRSMRAALRVVELKQIATRVDPVPTSGVTFAQLEPHHCRWPFGESPNMFFCAADRFEDLPYCLQHCSIAYETVAMRRARTKMQEAA